MVINHFKLAFFSVYNIETNLKFA